MFLSKNCETFDDFCNQHASRRKKCLLFSCWNLEIVISHSLQRWVEREATDAPWNANNKCNKQPVGIRTLGKRGCRWAAAQPASCASLPATMTDLPVALVAAYIDACQSCFSKGQPGHPNQPSPWSKRTWNVGARVWCPRLCRPSFLQALHDPVQPCDQRKTGHQSRDPKRQEWRRRITSCGRQRTDSSLLAYSSAPLPTYRQVRQCGWWQTHAPPLLAID